MNGCARRLVLTQRQMTTRKLFCNERISVRNCAVKDGNGLSAWVLLNTGITADGLVLPGKARKSTGSLHGTRYSMPKVQGRCLSSAGQ